MSNSHILLKVSGDYALFSRPEMKVERVSYDVMTPSAARGVLEAIYWKPQIRWIIDEIHVLNPIRFTNIRRNEISKTASLPSRAQMNGTEAPPAGIRCDDTENKIRAQRASLLLKDVAYLIKARVHLLDTRLDRNGPEFPANEAAGKHLEMFKRRALKGQAFQQPYFGCREFPVRFELIENGADLPKPHPDFVTGQAKDLGFMLHDIEFEQDRATKKVKTTTPYFFRAAMTDGVIHVPELPFPIKA
jgi:CRISPR-associated protein Cas5d